MGGSGWEVKGSSSGRRVIGCEWAESDWVRVTGWAWVEGERKYGWVKSERGIGWEVIRWNSVEGERGWGWVEGD